MNPNINRLNFFGLNIKRKTLKGEKGIEVNERILSLEFCSSRL